jgi:phage baseplate assembly protein W
MATAYRTTSAPLTPRTRRLSDFSAFYSITNADFIAVGDDAVSGFIYNVLSTLVGDEPFLPTYGCDLIKRTFEPLTAVLHQELMLDVSMALEKWVPQVRVDTSRSTVLLLSGNRVAGVEVAYQYAGSWWVLPVQTVQLGNY